MAVRLCGIFLFEKPKRSGDKIHQEEHHRSKTFREEYLRMLTDLDIEHEEKYLFEFYD